MSCSRENRRPGAASYLLVALQFGCVGGLAVSGPPPLTGAQLAAKQNQANHLDVHF